MSLKSTIHTATGAIINVLDTISVGLGIYSVGKSLNTLPQSLISHLAGGNGYKDYKPNWTKLNSFIGNHPYYPALMVAEKLVANAVVGFHTNLTLVPLLDSIIDDSDAIVYVAGFICGVDILHAWTEPTSHDNHHPEFN